MIRQSFLSAAGNVECLEVLIERGAAIDAPSASGTPLLWAISSGSEACINFLLDHGADVNCTTENGTSACLLAVATGAAGTFVTDGFVDN